MLSHRFGPAATNFREFPLCEVRAQSKPRSKGSIRGSSSCSSRTLVARTVLAAFETAAVAGALHYER